jgi:MoaA/NifB/PqqE/SkfB family radical SAM enzyme
MEVIEALRPMQRWSTAQGTPPGPVRIVSFPTNKCNLRCRHCWRVWAEWDRTFASELPDDRWLRLVDEAAAMGTRRWYFLGGGEPLTRRDLVMGMIRKMAPHGITSEIHTNGTLFTPEIIEELMDLKFIAGYFSLDGPNAELNNQIRGSGFDKAVENLRHFAACKQKMGRSMPELVIYATVTNLTYDKVDQFVELAASIGSGVKVFLSALIIEKGGSLELGLNPEQKAGFPEMVHRGLRRAEELGVETNFQRYLDVELIEDGTNMHRKYRPAERVGLAGAMCYEPWLTAAIMPDGQLGPCCAFYDPKSLSIKDLTLEQVWTGPYMQRVREGMFDGKPPAYCVRCPSNLYADKEAMRVILSDHLARAQESVAKRTWRLVNRAGSTLAQQGPLGTARRFKEWVQFHLK